MIESKYAASGHWLESGLRNTPRGPIQWQSPGSVGLQVHIGVIDGKSIASVKRNPYHPGYVAQLDGWMWTVDPDSTAGALGVKESNVVLFRRRASAQAAIQRAVDALPNVLNN